MLRPTLALDRACRRGAYLSGIKAAEAFEVVSEPGGDTIVFYRGKKVAGRRKVHEIRTLGLSAPNGPLMRYYPSLQGQISCLLQAGFRKP